MRKLILGLALASSVLSGAAVAQTPPAPPPPAGERDMPPPPPPHHRGGGHGLMRADLNKDGVITREEAREAADRLFARFDRNGDGRLTGDEMPQRHGRQGVRPHAEGKPDREISRVQFERKAMRRFERLDADKDGQVARAEIRQHRLDRKQQRTERREQG